MTILNGIRTIPFFLTHSYALPRRAYPPARGSALLSLFSTLMSFSGNRITLPIPIYKQSIPSHSLPCCPSVRQGSTDSVLSLQAVVFPEKDNLFSPERDGYWNPPAATSSFPHRRTASPSCLHAGN